MESVACEFVFDGINARDRAKLCSIVRSTNSSIANLEQQIGRLKTAVAGKRQAIQQQVTSAQQKVAQEPSPSTMSELEAARQRLANYDAKVATLTQQLEAYKKLPGVMQGLNKQISNVTEALTKQLPDISSPRAAVPPPATSTSAPEATASTTIPPFPKTSGSNPFLDAMDVDSPNPPSSPLATMNELMEDDILDSVAISTPKKRVAFKSPLSTVYNISPPAVPPKYSTREQRQSKISTTRRRPDLTAYTPLSPTETSKMSA